MRRIWLGLGAAALASLAGRASAQDASFGDKGHLALSAERLFGYVHTESKASTTAASASRSVDSVTVLANPIAGATGYGWPRIGIDGFVARGVSIGGSFGYFHYSPDGSTSVSGFVLAPRLGYAAMVGPRVAIWPRLGFTYEQISQSSTQNVFALTVEAPFTILVVPRAAFLIGPTADIGLGGGSSVSGTDISEKITDFGLQAGLLLFL